MQDRQHPKPMQEPHGAPSGLNKAVFQPGDRVTLRERTGSVVGIATRNIIDTYIVLLDEPLECGWTAISIHSTELDFIGL